MFERGEGQGKRGDHVPGSPRCAARTSLEVSFHRRGHEDTRVPPLVIHVTMRRCVIVEAARAGLIWDTFQVWRIFAPAREFKPTLLREMGFFNLTPVFLLCRLFFFPFGYYIFSSSTTVRRSRKSDFSENILENTE